MKLENNKKSNIKNNGKTFPIPSTILETSMPSLGTMKHRWKVRETLVFAYKLINDE